MVTRKSNIYIKYFVMKVIIVYFSGQDCEIAPNLCQQLVPCQNGGTCRGNTTQYECDCPLGFTGTNCEQRK